ncbi:glycoside hydrolase family 76 protein [Bisporella sp. PMI_857]|nr:glycoside hydrolase family 76 protein [Bisporella sp. PMI_857]
MLLSNINLACILPALSMVWGVSRAADDTYTSNSEAAFQTLQKWYNDKTGLYNTTGWWNSANVLTTIGTLAAIDFLVKPEVIQVLANSYVAAPATNLQVTKVVQKDFMIRTFYDDLVPNGVTANKAASPKGFLNEFYDDQAWWALAWIQAYDLTNNAQYLQTAVEIFSDMRNGSTTPCGGIWWDKQNTYVNAIANELYLSVGASLANRAYDKSFYLDIAQKQLDWFLESGMLNDENLINDGLTEDCKNNGGTVWSYNQGVILGALVELNNAAANSTYLELANDIATAAISKLGEDGVLHDPCEPDCGADGGQFKGIFMRNLRILQQAVPNSLYLDFIESNAKSIWNKNRNESTNELSLDWAGPYIAPSNASVQSSAMDALVAAASFETTGIFLS